MNWCNEHWEYLKAVIEAKGMDHFVGEGAEDGVKGLLGDRFDPLIGSWGRINAYMLKSSGLNGRILACPLCILVADGQPHLVKSWVDGCTSDALDYAVSQGLIERPEVVTIPEPPTKIGTLRTRPEDGAVPTEPQADSEEKS